VEIRVWVKLSGSKTTPTPPIQRGAAVPLVKPTASAVSCPEGFGNAPTNAYPRTNNRGTSQSEFTRNLGRIGAASFGCPSKWTLIE